MHIVTGLIARPTVLEPFSRKHSLHWPVALVCGLVILPLRAIDLDSLQATHADEARGFQYNRGCFVSDLSSAVARELMEFRALIEPRLAGWALDHLTAGDLEQARALMTKIEAAKFASERLRLATEFHTLIYRRANRPFFLEQVSRARNNLNRYWLLAWNEKSFPGST
jgi:hypothetical protein